jgi:hypothetical protein
MPVPVLISGPIDNAIVFKNFTAYGTFDDTAFETTYEVKCSVGGAGPFSSGTVTGGSWQAGIQATAGSPQTLTACLNRSLNGSSGVIDPCDTVINLDIRDTTGQVPVGIDPPAEERARKKGGGLRVGGPYAAKGRCDFQEKQIVVFDSFILHKGKVKHARHHQDKDMEYPSGQWKLKAGREHDLSGVPSGQMAVHVIVVKTSTGKRIYASVEFPVT